MLAKQPSDPVLAQGEALSVEVRSRPSPRADAHGLTCLLAPLHAERSLSLALVKHLTHELPDLNFTLEDGPEVDLLWLCGYERGNAALIRDLRSRHPQALFLVTAKEPKELWAAEAVRAGADHVLVWPVALGRLAHILRQRPLQRRA